MLVHRQASWPPNEWLLDHPQSNHTLAVQWRLSQQVGACRGTSDMKVSAQGIMRTIGITPEPIEFVVVERRHHAVATNDIASKERHIFLTSPASIESMKMPLPVSR